MDIYEMKHSTGVEEVLNSMLDKLSGVVGITITGNRVTLRWMLRGKCVDVHMALLEVTTLSDIEEMNARSERMERLGKKYKNL